MHYYEKNNCAIYVHDHNSSLGRLPLQTVYQINWVQRPTRILCEQCAHVFLRFEFLGVERISRLLLLIFAMDHPMYETLAPYVFVLLCCTFLFLRLLLVLVLVLVLLHHPRLLLVFLFLLLLFFFLFLLLLEFDLVHFFLFGDAATTTTTTLTL